MKILICGYGQVGERLARELSAEGHDLTLMDANPTVLESGMEHYDVISVQGNCASMKALQECGIECFDLLIACTGSDELNLLCCMTAHTLNPNLHTIARIRNPEYTEQAYRMSEAFGLSMTFNPEQQAAVEISRLLKMPGFLRRDSFARGRVEIVELRVDGESRLCNVPLSMLNGIVKCRVLVCSVVRNGRAYTPDGSFVLQNGDRVFVTAPTDNLALLLKNLGIVTRKVHRVMIAGGGSLAYYLCAILQESGFELTLIEEDRERCTQLAAAFPKANVICGDAREQELLVSENIAGADALVTLTGMDELNLMISLYGKTHEIPQIITLLESLDETGIIAKLPLDSIIAPRRLCCNHVVRYVRAMQNQAGAAVTIHSIADGHAEAMEFLVEEGTLHCGVPLKKLPLRKNVLLVSITSGNRIEIPNGDSSFSLGDTVVVVASGEEPIRQFNDIFA